jgi:hypothetical protein
MILCTHTTRVYTLHVRWNCVRKKKKKKKGNGEKEDNSIAMSNLWPLRVSFSFLSFDCSSVNGSADDCPESERALLPIDSFGCGSVRSRSLDRLDFSVTFLFALAMPRRVRLLAGIFTADFVPGHLISLSSSSSSSRPSLDLSRDRGRVSYVIISFARAPASRGPAGSAMRDI